MIQNGFATDLITKSTYETKMHLQKNSGNRGAKRETGASSKNSRFIQNFMDDLRKEGVVADVHIGRVIRKDTNRVDVFYVDNARKTSKGVVVQARIPGKFSGRGKHSVWIDVGRFVAVADSGIGGSAEFEIAAVFGPDQMREISKEFDIDPRVLAVDVTDAKQLVSSKMTAADDKGYDFDTIEEEDDDEELDIDGI